MMIMSWMNVIFYGASLEYGDKVKNDLSAPISGWITGKRYNICLKVILIFKICLKNILKIYTNFPYCI